MKYIQAIDDYCVELIQAVYLWLWDWVGVYVGTLILSVNVALFAVGPTRDRIDWFLLGTGFLIAGHRYFIQGQSLRAFNAIQLSYRKFLLRQGMAVVLFVSAIYSVAELNGSRFAACVLVLAWTYLACVQIRDREPKDFFRKLSPVGAK